MLKNKLTIEDKELFNKYFSSYKYDISDLNFTNLFMWRKLYDFNYEIINDYLCICGKYYDEYFAFPPLTLKEYELISLQDTIMDLERKFKANNLKIKFKFITKNILETMKVAFSNRYFIKADEDNFDYVYYSNDLINLSGRKYHTKKNHLNHFLRSYKYEYKEITTQDIAGCMKLVDKLKEEFKTPLEAMLIRNEEIAICEALGNINNLDYKGAVVIIDGEIQGFTLGEVLNNDTMVIHIEKGNYEYRGIFQYINKSFCEKECKDYLYVNREEDMGFDYLRKAKKSYYPAKMIEKYDAQLI